MKILLTLYIYKYCAVHELHDRIVYFDEIN